MAAGIRGGQDFDRRIAMNQKTARLLRKYSLAKNVPLKEQKKRWVAMDPRTRGAMRKAIKQEVEQA